MSLTIKAKTLSEILSIAAKVCNKSIVPIAECVHMTFGTKELSVQATDFENFINIETGNVGTEKSVHIAIIPCKQFLSIVSSLPGDQDVIFEKSEKRLTVKSGNSKYNFGIFSENEWPSVPWNEKTQTININAYDLLSSIQFVDCSMGNGNVRYFLNGLNLRMGKDNNLRFITADGHCTSFTSVMLEGKTEMENHGIIIPPKLVSLYNDLLSKETESVTLDITKTKVRLNIDSKCKISLMGRLLDAEFPSIDQLVPYGRDSKAVVVPREDLINSLRRAQIFCDQKTSMISMAFTDGNKIRISSKNNSDDAEEIIDIDDHEWRGTVYANVILLINLLSSLKTEKATLLLDSEDLAKAPILIMGDQVELFPEAQNFSLLMPMAG